MATGTRIEPKDEARSASPAVGRPFSVPQASHTVSFILLTTTGLMSRKL